MSAAGFEPLGNCKSYFPPFLMNQRSVHWRFLPIWRFFLAHFDPWTICELLTVTVFDWSSSLEGDRSGHWTETVVKDSIPGTNISQVDMKLIKTNSRGQIAPIFVILRDKSTISLKLVLPKVIPAAYKICPSLIFNCDQKMVLLGALSSGSNSFGTVGVVISKANRNGV